MPRAAREDPSRTEPREAEAQAKPVEAVKPSLVEVAGGMSWMRQTVKEAHAQMESHLQLFHLLPMQSNGWME